MNYYVYISVEPEMSGSQTFCLGEGQPDSCSLPSEESLRSVQAENRVVLILYSRVMPHPTPKFGKGKRQATSKEVVWGKG